MRWEEATSSKCGGRGCQGRRAGRTGNVEIRPTIGESKQRTHEDAYETDNDDAKAPVEASAGGEAEGLAT